MELKNKALFKFKAILYALLCGPQYVTYSLTLKRLPGINYNNVSHQKIAHHPNSNPNYQDERVMH